MTLLAGLALPPVARCDHFAIDLQVRSGERSRTAHGEQAGLGRTPKARSAFPCKAGEPLTVRWTLRSTDPKNTYKDVLVHCFVVKVDKAGQAVVPRLDRDVVAESALTMDFKPKEKAEAEVNVVVPRPGVYLLRLETIGAATGPDGHEHFAAVDLIAR